MALNAVIQPKGGPSIEHGYDVHYTCPDCEHQWMSVWSCACNDECPDCGARDIEADDYQLDGTLTQAQLDHYNEHDELLTPEAAELATA